MQKCFFLTLFLRFRKQLFAQLHAARLPFAAAVIILISHGTQNADAIGEKAEITG